jgi:DUF1009 family protein
MGIDQIIQNLQNLNAATAAPAKHKKKVAPALKINGQTTFSADEQLAMAAARILAAFDLGSKGVTVESLVAGVKNYEGPYEGVVQ